MNCLKIVKLISVFVTVSAVSGCFVSAGGSTDLDPGNPNSPQVGGQVNVDPLTGRVSPGISVGGGPVSVGIQL